MFMSIMKTVSAIVIQMNMWPITCNALLFNIAQLHLAHSL